LCKSCSMTIESLKSDLPIIVTTVFTALAAIISFPFDKNLAVAFTAFGSVIAAFISYMKARKVATIAADAIINTNAKTVFVESVTAERAIWRREMREATTVLTAALRWSAKRHRIDWEKVYLLCSEIRLRVNPAGRDVVENKNGEHQRDRAIHSLLDKIITTSSKDREAHCDYAEELEAAMANLLKQEWDKSKQEAIDGCVAGNASKLLESPDSEALS
jgi:hypothetical protein